MPGGGLAGVFSAPQLQVFEGFFDGSRLKDDLHPRATARAHQGINLPDFRDAFAPGFVKAAPFDRCSSQHRHGGVLS